eukprot:CAMPEP_0184481692 /NCGR_PEP_ID=MMETSP0113_2-20130426/3253_1 /TAXON_ID=91329 /ORGANISM="Norrisiella sphaerica, Strain BC52" /LENGTH=126 /DNA_ID=CAMNT_0026860973 /DNA_START=95 /DNA_END=475 /DNA_ORIENTATION=-
MASDPLRPGKLFHVAVGRNFVQPVIVSVCGKTDKEFSLENLMKSVIIKQLPSWIEQLSSSKSIGKWSLVTTAKDVSMVFKFTKAELQYSLATKSSTNAAFPARKASCHTLHVVVARSPEALKFLIA